MDGVFDKQVYMRYFHEVVLRREGYQVGGMGGALDVPNGVVQVGEPLGKMSWR